LTLVIAAYGKDRSIVMCSDSQATTYWHKLLNTKKLYLIKESPALLLGGSGDPVYVDMVASKILKRKERSIKSIGAIVGKIFDGYSDREAKITESGLTLELIVAIVENNKPFIYSVKGVGSYRRIRVGSAGYVSIGEGMLWSDWLLARLYRSGLGVHALLELLVYVIASVEEVAESVGGNIQAGMILQEGGIWRAKKMKPDEVSDIKEKVAKRDRTLRNFWIRLSEDPKFERTFRQLGKSDEEED